MCGIFGFYSRDLTPYDQVNSAVETLFRLSNSRGKEASGVAIMHSNTSAKWTVSYTKTDINALGFLKSDTYHSLIERIQKDKVRSYIGHARMTTHGTHLLEKNNQPVFSQNKKMYCVHNGIISNFEKLWENHLALNQSKIPDLDTQVVLDVLEKLTKTYSLEASFKHLYEDIEGVLNLALMFPEQECMVLSSNTGSLYWFQDCKNNIFFASEKIFLEELGRKFFLKENDLEINRVSPVSAVIIRKDSVVTVDLSSKVISKLEGFKKQFPKIIYQKYSKKDSERPSHSLPSQINKIEKLQQHDVDYQKIYSLQRCSRCILPITTPFIKFNNDGICNYCLEHTQIVFKGKESLEKVLGKYRKNNGEPDCLIAFSGGRDSSYGLHLLKKEWGMNPLAYTYDWGMISDLGRRNQARMLGALQVEQILVSADISQKRKHVRENILAWIKRPHLGMIPLFMEGDKPCEFYADQTMKKYNIKLMIYCRGNELEKEEFKAGHCGVRDADPGGVIHNLALKNKLKLLQFYGIQYLKNPAYLNSSVFDTAFAYFSTYIQPHNYLYLWHYLPWEEKKINSLLPELYNWETSPDTSTSWRIGDGTPAFYNYIYYQVQGFTENDSLRARQVREGIMSREKALRLVKEENKPQYNNLKWYFDTIQLDGDMVLSVVDKMKKLY